MPPKERPKLPPDDPFSEEAEERRADRLAKMVSGEIPLPGDDLPPDEDD